MTDLAAVLLLTLTLLPGYDVAAGRELARTTLERAGCADVRVEIHGRPREPVQIAARCKRLGQPAREGATGALP